MDIFEKLFGKAPEEGYEFTSVEVNIIDNDRFKGFAISWCAKGIGFGEVTLTWGLDEELKEYNQYGFHSDTELMSREFVDALMVAAAPKLAKIIVHNDRSDT